MRSLKCTLVALSLLGVLSSHERVCTAAAPAEAAPDVAKARELFMRGTALVRAAQWAEALAAFEQSHELRPHPITIYNMGACERALGRYTVARARLQRALDGERGVGGRLPESLRAEAKAYMAEIERLLVRVQLTVAPTDAEVAIDGRPLAVVDGAGGAKVFVAGLRPPGRGEVLPAGGALVVLDPGTHLLTLSRKGFSDELVTRTFKPGTQHKLALNLDELPAKVLVSSNQQRARVRIDLFDVGYAPVEVERPSGMYTVVVEKPGFAAYETSVRVNPGEVADIKARLSPTPITQKWWFWTAAGVLVTGAVVGTYFATRSDPAPKQAPPDGGTLDWALEVP